MGALHEDNSRQVDAAADGTISFERASLGIQPDVRRYHDIVKGKVREDLREYITSDDIVAQHGNDIISIPVREISTPQFVFGSNEQGVGEGEGEEGQGKGGKAGEHEGKKQREEPFHVEELADLLGEHLQLPRIQPRPTTGLQQFVPRYESISRRGPNALRDNKRTFLEALKRTIAEGAYDPENPIVVPIKDDFRYKSPKLKPRPKTNAVIIYMIDVSGSMGDLEKSLARNTAFWTDAWIDRQYKGTEKCYIIHDSTAKLVDREAFFSTRESGGTMISSAYQLAREQIATRFRPDEWNIYLFHFSDGENWSRQDNNKALQILKEDLLPYVNLFGFVEVGGRDGGDFKDHLGEELDGREEVVVASLPSREEIIPTIQKLLGTGR